jgi:uncharacterized phage-associated protein
MYSQEHLNKIGNTVVYLASNVENPSKTKLLKLLYLLDEISIKTSGIPFLNLQYKVWKFGPVASDIFVEFSSSPSILKGYIKRKTNQNGHEIIEPIVEFCDDEFSLNELELLKEVANKFNNSTVEELIQYTHRKNSPWHNTAIQHSVLELLENEKISSTDIIIDMSELIQYDERKLAIYNEYRDLF